MRYPRAIATLLLLVAAAAFVWFLEALRPPEIWPAEGAQLFEVEKGTGFRGIAQELEMSGLIRSAAAFQAYAFLTGRADNLQPGNYDLAASSSAPEILGILSAGPEVDTEVTLPEGLTAADMDALLAAADVTDPGAFLALVRERGVEGRLFPETYRFYFDSSPAQVLERMLAEFDRQAAPLLAADPGNTERNLVLASMLEREVPEYEDRRLVAGLLLKRAAEGVPLQVDATICYIKEGIDHREPCEPITALDKKIESPYNTYTNSGWPPGAISNPGVLAIKAALDPVDSPYWYYLSDPETGKTIFAKTLNEHLMNQLKYLNGN